MLGPKHCCTGSFHRGEVLREKRLISPLEKRVGRTAKMKKILPPGYDQKTQEGCGCPKFLAGKVFRQISTLLENSSPIFRQHEKGIPAKVWAFSGKANGY